tara:strand:+ start:2329 stop:2619 length:291 start_codon:yes stop_codon:yes gene_type:complete
MSMESPDPFITGLLNHSGFTLERSRAEVIYGRWLLRNFTKTNLKNLARQLVKHNIEYSLSKSPEYGDTFKFTYSNLSYVLNCKTKKITVYKALYEI